MYNVQGTGTWNPSRGLKDSATHQNIQMLLDYKYFEKILNTWRKVFFYLVSKVLSCKIILVVGDSIPDPDDFCPDPDPLYFK